MKPAKFLLLFALLFFGGSDMLLAQNGQGGVFQLKKLTAEDTFLDDWKLKPGDNPQYALPDFDDTNWRDFNPDGPMDTFKYLDQVCWMRLRLKIDSTVGTSDFGLMFYQNAASQIYVDGKLFKSYGTVSANPEAYNPLSFPEHITLTAGMHVIAVRFIAPRQFSHIQLMGYYDYVFALSINRYDTAVSDYLLDEQRLDRLDGENLFLIGIFFILTITHIVFYLYYRGQKAHLYYAFITFLLLVDCWLNIDAPGDHSISRTVWFNYIGNFTFAGFVFLPLTIYSIFGYARRWAVKVILAISAICMVIQFFTNGYDMLLFFYLLPFFNAIECIRVAIIARRDHQPGAIFIITGGTLFLILLGLQNNISGLAGEALFVLAMLSLPVGMTIFLAIRTALTYRALETKLVEVQELSEKNLQYQVEKQQILAGQNETLERQVTERTAELSSTLDNLKSTQKQLIQSEKMASLGELTAGIAHEIQNPLNFVNNFSEVSAEMIDELDEELDKGDIDEAKAIAGDIKQNLEKIRHHGKRADGIVRGMLEHSRPSTGQKEAMNINALADEYLKLAYHSIRSKEKFFNAEIVTDFDEKLPQIKAIPQDIGRVLMNLFNNAFYALNQKSKTAGPDYKPEVFVSTQLADGNVIVAVKDNGNGIPDAIKEKIMQPFFTTKPTGEGTGLGLSLSYDIVVKGHGGAIDVISKEGEGAEFKLTLPL